MMMWTQPNASNDFTVLGKCRVGHKSDILCVDSSSQFIASGGVDGLLSIWNLFSGTLKFAVELPPPRLFDEGNQIKDFDYTDNGEMGLGGASESGEDMLDSMSEDEDFSMIEGS
jgi:WD40 repeat protein